MRDFRAKEIMPVLPVLALTWLFIVGMIVYLLPVIPLVVISAKLQKRYFRSSIVEKPVGIYSE